ncbi:MAG: TonB-dependent receptor, partial [bacterium]|nr:TonB-dependent receptor [Candidatus Kapabacteria bacterium]
MAKQYWLYWMFIGATMVLMASVATAQTGSIRGTVVDASTGAGIVGATIRVATLGNGRVVAGAITNQNGRYHIDDIPAGSYSIEYSSIGFATDRTDSVRIVDGAQIAERIELDEQEVGLGSVVVSASRKTERALDAPASVWVADRRRIDQTAAITPADHLRGVAGVDMAQKGVMQTEVVARGFSNVFSGSLLTLADGRTTGVPSLRANIPYLIPVVNDDIERLELVRGPGSALFGPNAANGVLNIVTRSPFASQGTSLQLSAGSNELFHGEVRHADVIGERFGFKISGQYMRALDWPFIDSVEVSERATAIANGEHADTLRIGKRDPVSERFGGEARMDFLVGDNGSITLSGGFNQAARAIDLTSLGAAQAVDWRYSYFSARTDIGRFMLQGFFNASDAGETYLLRSGNRIVDRSQQIGARAQHASVIKDIADLTYGADLTLTRPNTDSTITGRNETNDDINEIGAYLQSESRFFDDRLSLVLAGRIDHHNRIEDLVFSPRAALAYKPDVGQQVRLTYNQAYSTPTTNDLFLDLVASSNPFGFPDPYAIGLRVSGMPLTGYQFRRDEAGLYFRSPFARGQDIPVAATASL